MSNELCISSTHASKKSPLIVAIVQYTKCGKDVLQNIADVTDTKSHIVSSTSTSLTLNSLIWNDPFESLALSAEQAPDTAVALFDRI